MSSKMMYCPECLESSGAKVPLKQLSVDLDEKITLCSDPDCTYVHDGDENIDTKTNDDGGDESNCPTAACGTDTGHWLLDQLFSNSVLSPAPSIPALSDGNLATTSTTTVAIPSATALVTTATKASSSSFFSSRSSRSTLTSLTDCNSQQLWSPPLSLPFDSGVDTAASSEVDSVSSYSTSHPHHQQQQHHHHQQQHHQHQQKQQQHQRPLPCAQTTLRPPPPLHYLGMKGFSGSGSSAATATTAAGRGVGVTRHSPYSKHSSRRTNTITAAAAAATAAVCDSVATTLATSVTSYSASLCDVTASYVTQRCQHRSPPARHSIQSANHVSTDVTTPVVDQSDTNWPSATPLPHWTPAAFTPTPTTTSSTNFIFKFSSRTTSTAAVSIPSAFSTTTAISSSPLPLSTAAPPAAAAGAAANVSVHCDTVTTAAAAASVGATFSPSIPQSFESAGWAGSTTSAGSARSAGSDGSVESSCSSGLALRSLGGSVRFVPGVTRCYSHRSKRTRKQSCDSGLSSSTSSSSLLSSSVVPAAAAAAVPAHLTFRLRTVEQPTQVCGNTEWSATLPAGGATVASKHNLSDDMAAPSLSSRTELVSGSSRSTANHTTSSGDGGGGGDAVGVAGEEVAASGRVLRSRTRQQKAIADRPAVSRRRRAVRSKTSPTPTATTVSTAPAAAAAAAVDIAAAAAAAGASDDADVIHERHQNVTKRQIDASKSKMRVSDTSPTAAAASTTTCSSGQLFPPLSFLLGVESVYSRFSRPARRLHRTSSLKYR